MKAFAKRCILAVLAWQVRRLYKKRQFTTIAVAGSIGKTSTKSAIASVLGSHYSVRYQHGNYNDIVSVPLIFFGETMPSLFNPFAWAALFLRNEAQLHRGYPYEIVVVEVGTDGPGQLVAYGRYLQSDYTVMTAITPEHMEFFDDIDQVAAEEFSVLEYSKSLIVNADLCDKKYIPSQISPTTYGTNSAVDYRIDEIRIKDTKVSFALKTPKSSTLSFSFSGISKSEVYSASAAAIVGLKLGMSTTAVRSAVGAIQPVSGRMQLLRGIRDSVIVDESYNASPEAVKAALDSLYAQVASQKIAILGNMNELGSFSPNAHTEIGQYCDPTKLDIVVTIGPDANTYLADAAEKMGCEVVRFTTPYAAGEYVADKIVTGAMVLVKGSQNNVYAEEAIKSFLLDPADSDKLVRQSKDWMRKKASNFKNG